jgi:DNA-3-methyladenine glycosylase
MKEPIVSSFKKLPQRFYLRKDVVKIAKELLGKIIVTNFNDTITAGRIVETEAYNGVVDKASHAYGNRRTNRTEIMFGEGGVAYVYLCYGIHHLFNVVTNVKDTPHAVLIRAVEPLVGIDGMLLRTGKAKLDSTLTKGPGNVSKAFGIYTQHTGLNLSGDQLYIAEDGYRLKPSSIGVSPRIGVDYAAEDALLPYRLFILGNMFVSGRKILNSKG